MKDILIEKVGNKLDSLNVFIYDVRIEEEGTSQTLVVVLDRNDDYIDLKTVVQATRILNPIIDSLNFIDSEYTLDVYAKEKGEINYEQ